MTRVYYFSASETKHLRFMAGETREVEDLFGGRRPLLPEEDLFRSEKGRVCVEMPANLLPATQACIEDLATAVEKRALRESSPRSERGGGALSAAGGESPWQRDTVEEALVGQLESLLARIIRQDRRRGLTNLFWLAYSKMIAQALLERSARGGASPAIRYRLAPLVGGLLASAQQRALRQIGGEGWEAAAFHLGRDFTPALVQAILHDQFPLAEVAIPQVNLQQLIENSQGRYALSFKAYRDLYVALKDRMVKGISGKDQGLYAQFRRWLPSVAPEQCLSEGGLMRILFHPQLLEYLFRDYSDLPRQLSASAALAQEKERHGNWGNLLEKFLTVLTALRRCEVLNLLRNKIEILQEGARREEVHSRLFAEGRLYAFGAAAMVVNNARTATILFADLRGFTRASESGVSERELTDQLYAVFDPLTRIVAAHGGRIDKFIGDGVMVTFGIPAGHRHDPLRALRTALQIQEMMAELRSRKAVNFHMGVSLHTGRVFVAHFLPDEERREITVIGRHVNFAGRLSSTHESDPSLEEERKEEFNEMIESLAQSLTGQVEEGRFRSYLASRLHRKRVVAGVAVDDRGHLSNIGIALSQDAVEAIREVLGGEAQEAERGLSFYDEVLGRSIEIAYVGDALFKGVEKAFPIYGVSYTRGQKSGVRSQE